VNSFALAAALLFASATLRVEVLGLFKAREALVESARGPQRVVAAGEQVEVSDGPPLPVARFTPGAGPLSVTVLGLTRTFDGSLEVLAKQGILVLVNEVPLESYVASVVSAEAAPGSPGPALDVLSIAVRSFALERMGRPGAGHEAPLCDQTHCQVSKGREGTTPEGREAAKRTDGVVLLSTGGAVAPALHHAACGGRTADARDVWPEATARDREAGVAVDDLLPGGGGAACASRPGEPPLKWTMRLQEADLARVFGVKAPLQLELFRGAGGLVQRLLVGGKGSFGPEELHLALGRALGWDTVRSARFSVEVSRAGEERSFLLRGVGHGHGVGLCQRGAAALARKGWGRERILARYFPRLWVGKAPGADPSGRQRVKAGSVRE
jgi:stage II sporulation protein D